jgi:1,4-alpha-glucan branching enzyme
VVLRPAGFGDDNRSLYFTEAGWAGGKVFAYWKDPVRQYLIDNALFWLNECRVDGIRYDEVTVIHHHGGDRFCRDLTGTLRYAKPEAIQIAEYWDWDRAFAVTRPPVGLGFDAALGDRVA